MRLPMTSDEYEGEFIIHETRIENGQRVEDREWVPRTVLNDDHRGRAVILGNGVTREKIDLHLLKYHAGGLKGANKAQIYGCNALYRDFNPDFLVANTPAMAQEIANTEYPSENIVYSNAVQVVKYPGKFHLIPQNVNMNTGALATYLACFDKHTQIYLVGFDCQPESGYNNNIYADTENYDATIAQVNDAKWINNMQKLFNSYPDVDFIWVHPNPDYNFPEKWNWNKNVRKITTRQFIGELGIGVLRIDKI